MDYTILILLLMHALRILCNLLTVPYSYVKMHTFLHVQYHTRRARQFHTFSSRQPDRSHPFTRSFSPSSLIHHPLSHPSRRANIPPQLPNLHHPLPRRPIPCGYTSRPTSPLSDLLQGVFSADSSWRSGRRGER